MIYLDTSALVKKYVREEGTSLVRRLMEEADHTFTSKIAYAEALAAFARRYREGDLSRDRYRKVVRSFERDWQGFAQVEVSDEILWGTRDVIRRHPLRGADAIHLSSALWVFRALRKPLQFISSDGRLLEAARIERLNTLMPNGRPETRDKKLETREMSLQSPVSGLQSRRGS